MNYGGKGGKTLRDSELTNDCVGDNDTTAKMYEHRYKDGKIVWIVDKSLQNQDDATIILHDCRVRVGDVQSMSFKDLEQRSPPPFNDLSAPLEDLPLLDDEGIQKMSKDGTIKAKQGYARKAKGNTQVL